MKYNTTNYKKVSALLAVSLLTTLSASAGVFDFESVSSTTPVTNGASWEMSGWSYEYDPVTWNPIPGTGFTSQVVSSTGVVGSLNANGQNLGGFISNSSETSSTAGAEADSQSHSGGGANGSSQFGVIHMRVPWDAQPEGTFTINGSIYKGNYTDISSEVLAQSFMFGETLNVSSIDIALTAYSYNCIVDGNSFVGSDKTIANDGQFYAIRIYGLSAGELVDYIDVMLAENKNGQITVAENWETVALSSLNNGNGVDGLAFQTISNISNEIYDGTSLSAPAYVAIDNIRYETPTTAVPEPAEWATILGGVALVAVAIRRKRK